MTRLTGALFGATLTLMVASQPVWAAQEVSEDMVTASRPTYSTTMADALVARPLMAAGTVLGAAAFIVTMPLSILGGNLDEAAEVLVRQPALATTKRCLGCTSLQDQSKAQRITPSVAYQPAATNPDGTPVQIVIR